MLDGDLSLVSRPSHALGRSITNPEKEERGRIDDVSINAVENNGILFCSLSDRKGPMSQE